MEGIPADNVTAGFGPVHIEVPVEVHAFADVVDHVAGCAVLSPETVLETKFNGV